ncbi:MAG: hypothetical protein J0M26_18990 [Planctomycetes bacterium]|nr:hypothetical protein [Planctomycetota bacterium]
MSETLKQFVFRCSKSVESRLVVERREMIYMMAFRGVLKELREGEHKGPYAMLFRSGVAALLDIRVQQGWLVEIRQFWKVIELSESIRLRKFYEDWLLQGHEHGISVRLTEDFDLLQTAEKWKESHE